MKQLRRKYYCRCRLIGRAHYARRCPRCGLYRRRPPGINNSVLTAESLSAYSQFWKAAGQANKEFALQTLQRIDELINQPLPQKPKAHTPTRPMTPQEYKRWARKASDWESYRIKELSEHLREPAYLAHKLEVAPVQRRYIRAAKQMLCKYRKRLHEAGWEFIIL